MVSSKRVQKLMHLARWMSWGVLGTLLLSIGSAYFPFSMVQEAHRRLAEQQQELDKARQAPGQLRVLQQQLTTLQQELAFLERGVSEREYIPTMLKQIEQTARERNMQVVAVRPQNQSQQNTSNDKQQKNSAKPYDEQLIEISLSGDFWNLVNVLKQLDAYPKILAVQTMQVQSKTSLAPSAQGNPELEVKMTVKAFIFRPSSSTPQNSESPSGG